MALRLVDIYRPDDAGSLNLPDNTYTVLGHWTYALDENQRVDRVLLEMEETEAFLDWVDDALPVEHRVVLQSVEATLPRPEPEEENEESEAEPDAEDESVSVNRISRAELYEDARDATSVSGSFVALTLLSTIVAAGGMLRNQTAVVIGAMMIAPLLGPSLALALSTTLGDRSLLGRSLWANILGGGLAFGGALGMGLLLPVDPTIEEIAARTMIGLPDVALAAAAGAAGVLAMTRAQATGLVGVMVAVALLPPAVALGLLLGAGHLTEALQAGLLTATNIVALNLAAVCTFFVMGVRPRDWRDLEQARTSIRLALVLWGGALALLIALLWLSG
ncbi:TIGR00341 family protein [Salinibacter sp. 10B]|uniref:TIGR00341 family protein n=1 Tax=Salinibacter sp. 10B TaxID=1923971 RepID=UPI000CF57DF9|nr:TIGR00341 family protein [Salinibacter sp. 10B]PQJ34860.1 TIGR00341 family protein [Salinibacter sp. 10B]